MNEVSLARRLGRLLSAVVLVAAGSYVFIYLVRWEWNRALIAGLFFLAAEAVLIADVVLGRIDKLGKQLEEDRARERTMAMAARLRANRPDSAGPFAWLAPDRDRLNVFLPILIGAGVVLSAVAYLVEQLSRVTAVPVAENELARGLSTMALPVEGLSPLGNLPGRPVGSAAPTPRPHRIWRGIAMGGLVVMLAALVVAAAQVLTSRAMPPDPTRAVTIDLVVMKRNLQQPDSAVGLALWTSCRVHLPEEVELESLRPVGAAAPDRLRMTLRPAPGDSDIKEFLGCLQDTMIDRVRADAALIADGRVA